MTIASPGDVGSLMAMFSANDDDKARTHRSSALTSTKRSTDCTPTPKKRVCRTLMDQEKEFGSGRKERSAVATLSSRNTSSKKRLFLEQMRNSEDSSYEETRTFCDSDTWNCNKKKDRSHYFLKSPADDNQTRLNSMVETMSTRRNLLPSITHVFEEVESSDVANQETINPLNKVRNRVPKRHQSSHKKDTVSSVEVHTQSEIEHLIDADSSSANDDEEEAIWKSLGGFIGDISDNKPMDRKTAQFGMNVINSEYRKMKEKDRIIGKSSRRKSKAATEICTRVREHLRFQSLPDVYIRAEDSCTADLVEKTKSHRLDLVEAKSTLLNLVKTQNQLIKQIEELKQEEVNIDKQLTQAPRDAFTIHANLRPNRQSCFNNSIDHPRAPNLKFRPVPRGSMKLLLEKL